MSGRHRNRHREQRDPPRAEMRMIEDLQRPEKFASNLLRLKEECDGFCSFANALDASFADNFATGGDVSGTPTSADMPRFVYTPRQAYSFALNYPCKTACVYINETQHKMIRARSRAFASTNMYWQGIVRSLKTYVVGRGHKYTVVPRHRDVPPSDDILRKAQFELDQIIKVNKYRQVQCEKLERQHEDGEHILKYITTAADGILRVRFVEPLLLWSPVNHDGNVWFGVRYEEDDYEDPKAYFIRPATWTGTTVDPEPVEVSAEEIQHRKINVGRNSPRGIPSTYPIQGLLEQSVRTLGTMGTQIEIRSRIALIRKHVDATKEAVEQLLSATAAKQIGLSTGQTRSVLSMPRGTVLDTSDQSTYEFPNQNVDSDKTVHSVQANLRAAAVKFGFPEYLVSANSGGASYAGSMVSEGPVVKSFEFDQQDMIDDDIEVFERGLLLAAEKKRLPDNILELVRIDAHPPQLAGRNRSQDVQADILLVQGGVVDKRTIRTRQDFDADEVEENLEREKEEAREDAKKDMAAGIVPDPNAAPANGDGKGGNGEAGPRRRAVVTARPFAAGDEERNKQRPES